LPRQETEKIAPFMLGDMIETERPTRSVDDECNPVGRRHPFIPVINNCTGIPPVRAAET
jgi:hypothetical protein